MQKEQFLNNYFRFLAVMSPLLMLIKSIWDKNFKHVIGECIILSLYALLLIFLWGFHRGATTNNKSDSSRH